MRTQAGCVPNDTDLQVLIQQQFKTFKPQTKQIVQHLSNGACRSHGVRVKAEWEIMSDPRFGVCRAANAEGKECILRNANPAACGLYQCN